MGGKVWRASPPVLSAHQYRPRDVLVYLFHTIETSKASKHEQITDADLEGAKKVYSENRLKDLGNEYSENYPNIHQVLARFHGLASRFTVNAITDLIKKLLADPKYQGKLGGKIKTGRHLDYPLNTPMSNLLLTILDSVGVKLPKIGDSAGPLALG